MKNAEKAKEYGLDWVMTTDHGGPNHSKVNLEQAYPELLKSREAVPEVLQFYGMEFDTPAADHSTLMIPKVDNESQILYDIESKFNKRDPYPNDGSRDTESTMIEALNYMKHWTRTSSQFILPIILLVQQKVMVNGDKIHHRSFVIGMIQHLISLLVWKVHLDTRLPQ